MITLTEEQQKVYDDIMYQIASPNGRNKIISARAGSGKTTLICKLVCDLLEMGKKVCVTTMTGKATAVLREKIETALYDQGKALPEEEYLMMETVAIITKKARVVGMAGDGTTLFQNIWRDPSECPYDVIFIDELSMVPQWVVEWTMKSPARVFGFGDACQLSEIGGDDSKENFRNFKKKFDPEGKTKWISGYGIKLLLQTPESLTQVLRSDNDIAFMCNSLRKTWMSKKEYIDILKEWANKSQFINYSNNLKDIKLTTDWQIICYTNKMCERINNGLAKGKDYPDLDDKIIINDNLNPIRLYNGNTLTFREFRNAIMEYNHKRYAEGKDPIAVCMKWQGEMPNPRSKNKFEREYAATYQYYRNQFVMVQKRRLRNLPMVMEKVFNDPSLNITAIQAQKLIERVKKLIKTSNQTAEKTYQYAVDLIEKTDWLASLKVIEASEALPKLYVINAGYGYAITTHKSQGSQYPKVCYIMEKFDRPLLYTAITRAEHEIQLIDLT